LEIDRMGKRSRPFAGPPETDLAAEGRVAVLRT
jgi:hypothetical protein